jgi:hypothetical protein
MEVDLSPEHAKAGRVPVHAQRPVPDDESDLPTLVGVPTGKYYRELPWWEVILS